MLGGAGHLRALSDRLGGGDLDAVQDVQALLGVCRRHLRPAGHLAGRRASRRAARSATSTTTAPTSSRRILDICGLEMPKVYSGVEQYPLSGVSMRYSFDARPTRRRRRSASTTRCSAPAAIWEDGWKAVALHAPITGKGHFDKDVWELYHVDADRCRVEGPGEGAPGEAAGADQGLVRGGREEPGAAARRPHRPGTAQHRAARPTSRRAIATSTIPGTSPVPEGVAVNVRGRSYKILADVEITDPNCSGVIFAHGSRFGGHSLFIKDKKLHYVYNFLGIKPEQQFVSPRTEAGQVHARHGVHAGEGRASTTSRSARPSST